MADLNKWLPGLKEMRENFDKQSIKSGSDFYTKMNLLQDEIQKCTKCELCKLEVNMLDKSKGYGKLPIKYGDMNWLMIGVNPSIRRFKDFCAFGGRTGGDFLDKLVKEAGYDKDNFYITNVCRCSTPANRPLEEKEIASCWNYLESEVKLVDPDIVVLLGSLPASMFSLVTHRVVKQVVVGRERILVYLPHPSFVERTGTGREKYKLLLDEAFSQLKYMNSKTLSG